MKDLLISFSFLLFCLHSLMIHAQDEKSKNKFSIGINVGGLQRNLKDINQFFEQNNINPADVRSIGTNINISLYTSKWNYHIDINTSSNQNVVATSFASPNINIATSLFSYSIGRFIKNTPSYSILAFGGGGFGLNMISIERGTGLASFSNVINNLPLTYNRVSINRYSFNVLAGVGIYKKLFKEKLLIGGRATYTNGIYTDNSWKFYRGNAVSDVPNIGLGILSYQIGINYMIIR